MISREAFEKFLQDIQNQIEEKDKASKKLAEDKLKAISENYRQRVSERVAHELAMATEYRRLGDEREANRHESLADIYKSLFNIQDQP